jgi:hypothetical protein
LDTGVGPLVLGGSREPTPVVIYTSRETPPWSWTGPSGPLAVMAPSPTVRMWPVRVCGEATRMV